MKNQKADAVNGNWSLYLLGYSNEKVRKALVMNIITKEELNARVSESDNKEKGTKEYIVIEAVDPKRNVFVDFAKTFAVSQR